MYKHKNLLIIILSSIVIGYTVGITTELLIYKIPVLNSSLFFSTYIPSTMAMVAVLVYLFHKVGTECLNFKLTSRSIIVISGGILVSWLFLRVINKHFSINPIYEDISKMSLPYFMVGVVMIGLIGPALEEIILRGYVFQSVQDKYGTSLAWIISVLISMIVHNIGVNNISIIIIIYSLGGIILITAVYQIGKIPSSIIVHGFMNIYMFVLSR